MATVGTVAAGRHTVFVYGTLLEKEVVRILLDRVPHSSPAVLPGYRRFSVKGRSYPAIIPVESERVDGMVMFGLTNSELDIFDAFEDFEYERKIVEISVMDQTELLYPYAYIWVVKDDPKLVGDWDFNEWRERYLADYLVMVAEFVNEYKGGDHLDIKRKD